MRPRELENLKSTQGAAGQGPGSCAPAAERCSCPCWCLWSIIPASPGENKLDDLPGVSLLEISANERTSAQHAASRKEVTASVPAPPGSSPMGELWELCVCPLTKAHITHTQPCVCPIWLYLRHYVRMALQDPLQILFPFAFITNPLPCPSRCEFCCSCCCWCLRASFFIWIKEEEQNNLMAPNATILFPCKSLCKH